jgi:signal transduction histidine kinase
VLIKSEQGPALPNCKKYSLGHAGRTCKLLWAAWLAACVFFLPVHLQAAPGEPPAPPVVIRGFRPGQLIAGSVTCLVDSARSAGLSQIRQIPFSVPYNSFVQLLNQSPAHKTFWLKFSLANQTDSALLVYLYCGEINFTDLYFITHDQPVQRVPGGNLRREQPGGSFIGNISPTLPFRIQAHQQGELILKLIQKTEEYHFDDIFLYDEADLSQTLDADFEGSHYFMIFQLVFQGILICQLLYVLFQWMIIRRWEYLYYFFYLLSVILYFLSKYEKLFAIDLLFSRYPLLTVYLNKTLLILPYFFYFRFVRSFLEMPVQYPVMNQWIIRIEYFLLAYLVFDLAFILATFNVKLQRELYTYILFMVFIASASFIIYLFRQKKPLIYYILSGSLFVGLGNIIAMTLTYLDDEKIMHSSPYKLVFSQAGIILEIFCFTAGLSYKSMSAEKEKIKSQEKLIEQLKANDMLQNKMQLIRNQIAQDLHDDIGSTLSSISILSNMAIKEKNANQAMSAMHEIKNSTVTLMERMDDIVWSINPKNDSLENLLLRIKRFATSLFEAKNMDYTITIEENIHEVRLPMEYRQHIYLILKEGINNIIKYSDATKAMIRVSYRNEWLELLLEDNGKGFDSTGSFSGNGLPGMKNRAGMMQADLVIQSAAGQGTKILLRLKIK